MSEQMHREITEIINKSTDKPTIVNENSNFVVITYWWGRGRLNRNTARPCTSFYEDYLKDCNKTMLNLLHTIVTKHKSEEGQDAELDIIIETVFTNLHVTSIIFKNIRKIIRKMIKHYINDICDYKNIDQRAPDRFLLLKEQFRDFLPNLTNPAELYEPLLDIVRQGIIKNKENLIALYKNQEEYDSLKAQYMKFKHNQELIIKDAESKKKLGDLYLLLFTRKDPHETIKDSIQNTVRDIKPIEKIDITLDDLLEQVHKLKEKKDELKKNLIDVLKKKEVQSDGQNKSIFDLLIDRLEYKTPILFEQMIANWENACREAGKDSEHSETSRYGCNYMAIEYPEFARPGGNQMAINAKPKFIQKALELCGGKSVLYIDGDMTIRQYPAIFDMDNVDFMARGWWIDPRSSWKAFDEGERSIMYDPYNLKHLEA